MHYQKPPFSETKLIRCIQGSIYDVAIDLRKGSSTYLKSFGIELSSDNMTCILIPEGFQTLVDDTALIYHHTNYYTPNTEEGVKFDDKILNIKWPLQPVNISSKDLSYSYINENFKTIST